MSKNIKKEENFAEVIEQSTLLREEINLLELPDIIDSQIEQIEALSIKIQDALGVAEEAKSLAEQAENMPVKMGHKKKAIRKLQESGQKNAEAIGETVDALNLSFKYEQQLGEISKFLIAIASYSTAHTHRAIERINEAIQNRPSGKALNEDAKQRLGTIIDQIKAQSEAIKKQELLANEMKEKNVRDEEQNRQIEKIAADYDIQNILIDEMQKKIDSLERWLAILLIVSSSSLVLTLLHAVGILQL